MNAVILAGGIRSGQELEGAQVPRALWPMPSDPLITAVITFLRRHNVQNIAICANGKTPMIAAALAAAPKPWLGLHYSEDRFPRGPAGCLKDLESWLGDEPFIAIQGTGLYHFDLAAMIRQHADSHAAVTVGATADSNPGHDHHLQPAGVYVLNPSVLSHINPVGYQDIKEQLLPKILATGLPVRCHTLLGDVQLIHGIEHYLNALQALIPNPALRPGHDMTEIRPGVWAHPTARIAPTARFTGPVWIDRNAQIHDHALIAGPALLGPDTTVGARAIVHRAAVLSHGRIAAGTRVSNTVLPPHASRAAQTSQPRLRGQEQRPLQRAFSLFSPSRRPNDAGRTDRFVNTR